MARPVTIRQSYTGDRSRLMRLEMAVERDPRISSVQKTALTDQIRRLLALFMELDSKLPPLPEEAEKKKKRRTETTA